MGTTFHVTDRWSLSSRQVLLVGGDIAGDPVFPRDRLRAAEGDPVEIPIRAIEFHVRPGSAVFGVDREVAGLIPIGSRWIVVPGDPESGR